MRIPFDEISARMMEKARLKNISALAADLGVTPQALSNYKKRGDFPVKLILGFADKHAVSVDWLVGNKPPLLSADYQVPPPAGAVALGITGLTDDETAYVIKLLKILRAPDAMLGRVFRASIDALVENEFKEASNG